MGPINPGGAGASGRQRHTAARLLCASQQARAERPAARTTILRRWRAAPIAGRSTDEDVEAAARASTTRVRNGGTSTPASSSRSSASSSARQFLFRVELEPAPAPRSGSYRISDLELASRLSFFLWSSIPDDELLDLAERGQAARSGRPRAAGAADAGRSARRGVRRATSRGSGCRCASSPASCRMPSIVSRLRRHAAAGASSARPSCSSTASCARTAACSSCSTPTTRSSTSGSRGTTASRT